MNGYEGAEITWVAGRYGGSTGHINGVHLFSISWGHAANRDKPYRMTCVLPGVGAYRAAQEDALKRRAGKILVDFAASIVRPVSTDQGPDF